MTKIDKKIKKYVVKTTAVGMSEQPLSPPALLERPEEIHGKTYKLKTHLSPHAMYITINNTVVDGKTVPYEIFINSKDMQNFQWISALTRTASAVFRHGGDCRFLVDEWKNVFDPAGGYFHKSGFMPSVVAHIGHILEKHLDSLTLLGMAMNSLDEDQKQALKEKVDGLINGQ